MKEYFKQFQNIYNENKFIFKLLLFVNIKINTFRNVKSILLYSIELIENLQTYQVLIQLNLVIFSCKFSCR